jgi:hypothetical protein
MPVHFFSSLEDQSWHWQYFPSARFSFTKKGDGCCSGDYFIALAILSPAGPTPGSIEGIVYTVLPLQFHLIGLPEALLQTLALSFLFCFWERRPEEKKIWIPLLAIFIAILALSILGVLFGGTAA